MIAEVVPRDELPASVGLGTVAINVARAVGPAIAGVIIVAGGPGPVFLINAASVLGVVFVLWRWRRETHRATLPAERMATAVRAGIRYVRYTPARRAGIRRTAAVVLFARARWALNAAVADISRCRVWGPE